jgi:hypothetical protein
MESLRSAFLYESFESNSDDVEDKFFESNRSCITYINKVRTSRI